MDDMKKFFYEKPLLIVAALFIVLSVADIIFATLIGRGIMFEGSIWFSDIITSRATGNAFNFELYWGDTPRGIVNFLNTLPINLALLLPIKSKVLAAAIFSLPFFLYNFLILIAQYLLTLKSKRIDIFLSALFLHAFIIIPLALYPVIEISLASSVLILLFHYISADIEYKKREIFFIILLTLFSYLSTEAMIYCGVILFIISIYYAVKAKSKFSKFVKLFIGVNCLVISLFQNDLYKHFAFDFANPENIRAELDTLNTFVHSYYFVFDVFFLALIILAIFYPRKIGFKSLGVLVLLPALYSLYVFATNGYMTSAFFSIRFFPALLLPLVFIVNTLVYVFLPKLNEEKREINAFNIAIIILIGAIFNLIFSINNSYQFNAGINKLRTVLQNSENTLLNPYSDTTDLYAYNSPGSYLFNCDTYTYDSVNFSKEQKLTKIIVPVDDPESSCPKKFYFDKDVLGLQFSSIANKSPFWDLSEIKNFVESDEEASQKYKEENFEE